MYVCNLPVANLTMDGVTSSEASEGSQPTSWCWKVETGTVHVYHATAKRGGLVGWRAVFKYEQSRHRVHGVVRSKISDTVDLLLARLDVMCLADKDFVLSMAHKADISLLLQPISEPTRAGSTASSTESLQPFPASTPVSISEGSQPTQGNIRVQFIHQIAESAERSRGHTMHSLYDEECVFFVMPCLDTKD